MARIYPLFSSSKGNCTYIGSKNEGILIDDGISFSRLNKALEKNSLSLSAVKAVFITHEHSDHIKGLSVFTKKSGVPVFARRAVLEYLKAENMINGECFEMSAPVEICGMVVSSFSTPHDARESCGYSVAFDDGKRFALCTDLGHVTDEVERSVLGADAVLLEANYDIEMLRNGSYPYYLKERIFSGEGHLSNDDSGKFAKKLIESGTTHIILGHLSQENNTPQTAEAAVWKYLSDFKRNTDYMLSVAPVETSGGFIAF